MCRYASIKYKPHYACFKCRKTYKRRLLVDISENSNAISSEAKCPQCKTLMADMGLDFKSPKKDNIKSWDHVSLLFEIGITFHSCGCSGPDYIPKNKETLFELSYQTKTRIWSGTR